MGLFKKILIANRGEIAMRVIRACRELGISTVSVFSAEDNNSLHVKFADESVCIGPATARDSYLNAHSILSAAEVTGAEAVHPGYGFLSERSEFADQVRKCGMTFIGPSPENMDALGDKLKAKGIARRAKVPTLNSEDVSGLSDEEAIRVAQEIGFPVIIKAALGGGGRGMRVVQRKDELVSALSIARSEAKASFKSDVVYLEKYCVAPRHIEFQILADRLGNICYLPERECTIQRRHQKLLEESPSAAVDAKLRKKMGEAAVRLAKEVGYENVGTVEFLLDSDGQFYFLEVNTRIQVEHPVTELVTGLDLIKQQILLAAGEPLSSDMMAHVVEPNGHAIECRINAEDPETFAPCPGVITDFHVPCGLGVRLESVACAGGQVSRYYDSMIAKLIVHGENRPAAIQKMRQALREFIIGGIKSNIPLQQRIIDHPQFQGAQFSTGFLASEAFTGQKP